MNNQFFKIFRTLKKQEVKGFRKYCAKHIGEENIGYKALEYILRYWGKDNAAEKLTQERLYDAVFDGLEFKAVQVNNTLSDLTKVLKSYLMMLKLDQNTVEGKLVWASVLRERGLYDDYERTLLGMINHYEENKTNIADYTWEQYLRYLYINTHYPGKSVKDSSLFDAFQLSINMQYWVFCVKQASDLANMNVMKVKEVDMPALINQVNQIEQICPNPPFLLSIFIKIFRLNAFVNDTLISKPTYFAAKQEYINNYANLDRLENHTIYRHLVNYVGRRIQDNLTELKNEYLELTKLAFISGAFAETGVVSSQQFLNIIQVAITSEEVEWVKQFRIAQLRYLSQEIQEQCDAASEAPLLMLVKNYGTAFFKLEQIDNSPDETFRLRNKVLAVTCVYFGPFEDDHLEAFLYSVEKMAIRKEDVHWTASLGAQNFLKIVRAILNPKYTEEHLMNMVNSEKPLASEYWLKKMINARRTWGNSGHT